jgi:hypothetical protein
VSLTSTAVCDLFQVTDKTQALELKSQGKLVRSSVVGLIRHHIVLQ